MPPLIVVILLTVSCCLSPSAPHSHSRTPQTYPCSAHSDDESKNDCAHDTAIFIVEIQKFDNLKARLDIHFVLVLGLWCNFISQKETDIIQYLKEFRPSGCRWSWLFLTYEEESDLDTQGRVSKYCFRPSAGVDSPEYEIFNPLHLVSAKGTL
jgi:hypothetical protein